MSALTSEWIDAGKEPRCKPNSDYPFGKDVDLACGEPSCSINLPYPAPRIGIHYVECSVCGYTAAITTAGRPDDPRSARLPCKVLRERA